MDDQVKDPDDCCRRSFAASMKDTARRLLEDPSIAPRSVSTLRLEVCEGCEHFRANSKTCEVCGCYLPLKVSAANMECPVGKWTAWKKDTDITSFPDT